MGHKTSLKLIVEKNAIFVSLANLSEFFPRIGDKMGLKVGVQKG